MERIYCLDTSLLINGWVKRYRRDVFPHVWSAIGQMINEGNALVPWEVWIEIQAQKDDLHGWMSEFKDKFERPSEEEQEAVRQLMKTMPHIAAQGGSKNAADPFVIALAQIRSAIVVTDEEEQKYASNTKSPKITYICDQLGVLWIRPIDFLAEILK